MCDILSSVDSVLAEIIESVRDLLVFLFYKYIFWHTFFGVQVLDFFPTQPVGSYVDSIRRSILVTIFTNLLAEVGCAITLYHKAGPAITVSQSYPMSCPSNWKVRTPPNVFESWFRKTLIIWKFICFQNCCSPTFFRWPHIFVPRRGTTTTRHTLWVIEAGTFRTFALGSRFYGSV